MREIKFRSFDKVHRKMIGEYNLFNGSEYFSFGETIMGYGRKNIIFMQFTGLKDNNRKEIYEGDIVKLVYGIPGRTDVLIIEYAVDKIVENISVSGWWMRNVRENGVSASLCESYDLEVIGNIYENPDLVD